MLQLSEQGGFSALHLGEVSIRNSPIKPLYLGSCLEVKLSLKLCVRSRGTDHNTTLFKSFKLTNFKLAGIFTLVSKW